MDNKRLLSLSVSELVEETSLVVDVSWISVRENAHCSAHRFRLLKK